MKRSTWKKRALASALALTMAASVLPMAGFAAGGTSTPLASESGTDGLEMHKTAKLEDDGTYTINLEAWATGETTTVTTTTPTDIVLLLDVSGSMSTGKLTTSTYSPYTGTVWDAYYHHSGRWDEPLYHKCADGTYHKVSISYGYTFDCTNGNCDFQKEDLDRRDSITADWGLYLLYSDEITYMQALQLAVNNFIDGVAEKNAALQPDQRHSISLVKFSGKENTKTGNDTYEETINWQTNTWNYSQIVKEMTEMNGDTVSSFKQAVNSLEPNGATRVDYGMNRAVAALQNRPKDHNKVIILFSDGVPSEFSDYSPEVANNAIKTAKTQKSNGVTMYSIAVLDGANPNDTSQRANKFFHAMSSNYPDATSMSASLGERVPGSNYYKTAANADELNNIFQEIEDEVSTTDVTLDANAVLKDIVADQFIIPEGATATAVSVACTGKNEDGTYTWSNDSNGTYKTSIDRDTNTVSVTGFNYKEQFVHEEDGEWTGSKLVVTIKGVEALDAAATGTEINTNALGSGIYENSTAKDPVAEFVSPKTQVNKELYVLDYAKPANLKDDMQPTRTHLDTDGMNQFGKENPESNLKETYGTADLAGDGLTYTPTTMNWKGYDTFYSFGKDASNQNIWSKVSVMPANNVYYEDNFMKNIEGSGIVYTGDWKEVSDNTEDCGNNTETPNNGIHGGWVPGDTGLSDDTGYSDGSAHEIVGSNEQMATASFTFTGTGVDVYTRTNDATLTVIAQLRSTKDNGASVAKTLMVNNQSVSGDYYQIPTLTFTGLKHGTYTVTIRVTGITGTYYLDGIRVYNPIQGSDVDNAYGNEADAVFHSVREILLDETNAPSDGQLEGPVFIDKIPGQDGHETNAIGTYKDYGPKNEVYLAPGQSIAFKLDGFNEGTAYIGLKAPTGQAVNVEMSNGANMSKLTIGHSTDLYYEITPNQAGLFVIKNTSDASENEDEGVLLLSITKLRTTGATTVGKASVEALLSYVNTMDTLPEVPYGDEGSNGSEDGGNVDIENPDQGQETPSQGNSFLDIVKDIFESIWNWF